MVVQYLHMSSIIPDNDAAYFSLLRGVIDSVDPYSQMLITKGTSAYHFRLVPSNTMLIDNIVKEITQLSSLMGIQLELSKSIKSSSTVAFQINL